ncbi:30S ribosomal protein S9 [Candidatus Woesearchaeota archaeon CG10_big_fil_rev_8_21_14_0_10_30_7]|nr:MAG: 30S ribosomal protein S9 [Candidatus Woesearchaeota archaeon CG10_big_fil_rev_8_21_14_0_10_30_7]
MKNIQGTGIRKRAVARATLKEGKGIIRINSTLIDNYTPALYRDKIKEPLQIAEDTASKVNINVNVFGGGISSQADAARIAISKALEQYNKKLHKDFLEYDRTLLVADIRRKEPSKPNRHGQARSKRQKSYR